MEEKYKNKYRIESNRLKFWDYSDQGYYYITICISERESILGNIIDGKMILSEFGKIVESGINKIPEYHKRAIIDAWVVMPNHIHVIISLGNYDFYNGISLIGDINNNGNGNGNDNVEKIHEFSLPHRTAPQKQPQWWQNPEYKPTIDEIKQCRKQRRKMLIPKILGKFQQQTSKQINILRNTPGHKNWQANYHDHIIRNDKSYNNIKNYIINNPQKWEDDKFNSEKNDK